MSLIIPTDRDRATVTIGSRTVQLTNLHKPFWNHLGLTKRHLIQYYADVSPWLLPHLTDRAMVMKRYPNGADGEFFYMKRAPEPRPSWIAVCPIPHRRGNVIAFPMIQDLATLLWLINLGCIDLHPWYARCDAPDDPDFLNFDLDPVPGADFRRVCEVALLVHELLDSLGMPNYPKTSGSHGVHVYVPIRRGPSQKAVWTVAKTLARELAARHPKLMTAEYRIARRPRGRVLVDYNQNAWGRTLASVYAVRPTVQATVSTPVRWEELTQAIRIEDFRMDNVLDRLRSTGDLWGPLLGRDRFDLSRLVGSVTPKPKSERRGHTAA
jgi:bifunctional non-homologous end joining protein LigD